jgi:hypothetical protein
MHHSRLCAVLIDCKTPNVDEAADFWAEALGREVGRLEKLGARVVERPIGGTNGPDQDARS